MVRKKIIFFVLFITVSVFIVLEGLTKTPSFFYRTDFSKIAELYQPIKDNKDIKVIAAYPMAPFGDFPRGYQLLGQVIHKKSLVNGTDPFSSSSKEIYARVSDISDPKTIDELTRLGVDTIVIHDQLLNHASEVIGRLMEDDRLAHIGYYAVRPGPNPYTSLNDLSKSIIVFQIKQVSFGHTDRPKVTSDADKTTFAKQDGYTINVSLSRVKTGDHLYFSQTYSPDWKVYAGRANGAAGISYLWKSPVFDRTHEMNGEYGNRWKIDADETRSYISKGLATENLDGSINMDLTIFFRPRALFILEWGISFAAFAACLGYVGWDWARSKKQKARAES